ncbi:hypothetical protein BZA77DRAFT_294084 [Pyronema omphalodes]|nr:hypothetical protein BZA77DRAFT_294084 [Pyronema omphalodes]
MATFLNAAKYIAHVYVDLIHHLHSVAVDYISPASESAELYQHEPEVPSAWDLYLTSINAPRLPEHKLHEYTLKTLDVHLGPGPILRAQPSVDAESHMTSYNPDLDKSPTASERYLLPGGEHGYSLTSFNDIRNRYCHHQYGRIPPIAPRIVKTHAEDVEPEPSLEDPPADASNLSRFWAPRFYEASWQWTIWFGINPRHVYRDWEKDGAGNWEWPFSLPLDYYDSGYNSVDEYPEENEGEDQEAKQIREMAEQEKKAQELEKARNHIRMEPKQNGPKISFLKENNVEQSEEEKEEYRRIQAEKDAAAKKAIDDTFNSIVWDDDE